MQWCLFSCQKPFANIQNIDRYFDHIAGLLDCIRRGLKELRGRGWWSILPQGLCLLLYIPFVLHLILFTMATTMTGWYLIQKALPVFSIQIKVIMHSPSLTIHSQSFILPTCSLIMGHKDACNGYRLLQHRIHVWYHVGRTHTYPEHIGRQGVHSKATEYPLKVLQRGSPFSDIYIHLEHNPSNQHWAEEAQYMGSFKACWTPFEDVGHVCQLPRKNLYTLYFWLDTWKTLLARSGL